MRLLHLCMRSYCNPLHLHCRSDYQIFKKIVELDYEYPESGFDVQGRDLVEKLLVCITPLLLSCHSRLLMLLLDCIATKIIFLL